LGVNNDEVVRALNAVAGGENPARRYDRHHPHHHIDRGSHVTILKAYEHPLPNLRTGKVLQGRTLRIVRRDRGVGSGNAERDATGCKGSG